MKWGAVPAGTWTEADGTTDVGPGDVFRVAHHFQIFLGEILNWLPTQISGGWDKISADAINQIKAKITGTAGSTPIYVEFTKSASGLDTVIDMSYIARKGTDPIIIDDFIALVLVGGAILLLLGPYLVQTLIWLFTGKVSPVVSPVDQVIGLIVPVGLIAGGAWVASEFVKGRK